VSLTPFTLMWTRPSSRGWPSLVSSCICLLDSAYSCRRVDPPSPDSRPSSRVGRFAGAAAFLNVRAPLLFVVSILCFGVRHRAPFVADAHMAVHTTAKPNPRFFLYKPMHAHA
jgi:hypothetical protein